jgi:hypothetical protein
MSGEAAIASGLLFGARGKMNVIRQRVSNRLNYTQSISDR